MNVGKRKVAVHRLCYVCFVDILVIQYKWFGLNHHCRPSFYILLTPVCFSFPPHQPIVDLSPIRRSASSLTPQYHQEGGLREYNLERPDLAQSSSESGQVQGQDRAHHHHHHHRCHRRRDKDKDKKQKSLDRAASVQPSSTVGKTKKLIK